MALTKQDLGQIKVLFQQNNEIIFDVLGGKIDALADRVTALEERMIALEERMTALEERVSSLEDRISSLEERVSSVEDSVKQLQIAVEENKEEILLVKDTVLGIRNELDTEHEIRRLRIVSNEKSIVKNRNKIFAIQDFVGFKPKE